MRWFRPSSPVASAEEAWLEENLAWLVEAFERPLVFGPPLLPTPDDFPETDFFSPAGARQLLAVVSARMGVDPADVDLDYLEDDGLLPYETSFRGEAGHYLVRDGRAQITVYGERAAGPGRLVATIAHELAHVRLLGEGRIDRDRRDGEPLTDLATVALGLGVFSANAAYDYTARHDGWSHHRLGYLTEQMFGYALARYALIRGETEPRWAEHLDTNPRGYMRAAVRYLTR